MLVQSSESSCENNIEMNQLKYISTYKMGQIGITKLIEEPYKSSLNTENNLSTQHQQIIKIPSNTNTNTNTNNTNSNTNTNTFKAMDNISNKKNLKYNYSSSNNNVKHIQSSTNFNYYKNRKNKSNQKKNIINNNKNDSKQKSEAVKLNKNQFSKTENNLCLYINNNFYKSKNNNSYKKSYLNKNFKSKSNSKIHSESGYSNYILSSRTPSSIRRNNKKIAISNLITKEKEDENKIDSFKKDNIHSYYLKTNMSNNLSNLDIQSYQKNENENINLETKYQLTELNTYLKVRKRDDILNQKQSNSNLKIENNKLISSCILEKEKKEKIFSEKAENLYLSEVLSTENNIKEKSNIKLILIDNKNTNRLFTENNKNINNKLNNSNFNFNINILHNNKPSSKSKNISTSKNNLYSNKRKNTSHKDLNNTKFSSKTYSQMKNKTNNNKSNIKEKNEDNENINNFNKNHNNNNKNKNAYKPRKDFSVNSSKKQIIKDNKDKDKKINLRYNSFVNIDHNINNNTNKNKDKKNNDDLNQNEKKDLKNNNINENILNKEIKFDSPEDLHFFMVNLTQNCRISNSNF